MEPSHVARVEGEAHRYTLCRVGRLALLRWWAAPEHGDLRAIIAWLASQQRQTGSPLVMAEVVSEGVQLPTVSLVREAARDVRGLRYVRSRHVVVIEGDALDRALVRGVFATLTFVLGETLQLANTVDEAVIRLCEAIGASAEATLRDLDEAGVLRGPSPSAANGD